MQNSIAAGNGFQGTSMKIIGANSINHGTLKDGSNRAESKAVDTGWTARTDSSAPGNAVSDVLTLWGLQDIGATSTDTFALSLSFDPTAATLAQEQSGQVFMVSQNAGGQWVNACDLNTGGTEQFVLGAYSDSYALGTYGVDLSTDTAWAVVNHDSEFAVVPEPATMSLLVMGGLAVLARRRHK